MPCGKLANRNLSLPYWPTQSLLDAKAAPFWEPIPVEGPLLAQQALTQALLGLGKANKALTQGLFSSIRTG